jgi:iron complex outermembrane receptor protein
MNNRKNPKLLAALLGSTAVVSAAQVLAQAEEAPATLEEVIVTAQKREENVQDVPIAIDALSRDTILQKRIMGTDDLVKELPNLSLKTSSAVNSGFAIRGVGTQNFHVTAQQAVGLYFDEISQVTPFTSQLGLFDMERIEVLRGPQNTLFGRNTTGGAVNFITRRPRAEDDANGYINVNLGNYGKVDGEGAVGFKLGETFSMRAAAQVQTRDGVFHDVVSDQKIGSTDRKSARLGFGWDPSDTTNATLSFHYGNSDGTRVPRKATGRFEPDNVTTCPNNDDGASQFEGTSDCIARRKGGSTFNPSLPGWHDAYDAANNEASVKLEGGLFKFEHDFGGATLAALTGYDYVHEHLVDESGGLPYVQFQAIQEGEYRTVSQEFRISSTGDGRAKWIGGVFYSHENDHFATTARNNAVGPPTRAVVPTSILNQQGDVYSAYGQLDFKITDQFNMNAGLRYTKDDKVGQTTVVAMFDTDTGLANGTQLPIDFLFGRDFALAHYGNFTAQCAPGVVPCNGPWKDVEQDVSKTTGKIGFDYHFTDDLMTYVSYSTGFKSGAFDTRAQAVLLGTGDLPVKPEELNAIEIGMKSEFLEHRMKLNVAAFWYDWKDLQTFATIPGIGPAFLNLPKSKLTGQEVEWKFAPGSDWLLHLYGAHLDTKVTDVGTLGPDAAIVGAPLPQAPEWTYNAGIAKGIAIGDNKLTFDASVRYASEQWGTMTKRVNTLIGPTTFVDFSASFDFGSDNKYSLTAWGENLTSEKTCLLLGDLDGFTWTNACQPNEGTALYGVSLMAKF